jgi:hypothetical protein
MVKRENISELLHTALRKLCDSKITSAAWNMMYLLSPATTQEFYGTIWKRLEKVEREAEYEEIVKQVRLAITKDFDYIGSNEKALVYCVFCCFDKKDWDSYCSYVTHHWKDEPKNEA